MQADTSHRRKIQEFIAARRLLVLATVSDTGAPEAALVAYGETPEGRLVVGTSNRSRKYANLQHNPAVAVVIGWEESESLQIDGSARFLSEQEAGEYIPYHLAKNPDSGKYSERPDQAYILITPVRVRYIDIATEPETSFVLDF